MLSLLLVVGAFLLITLLAQRPVKKQAEEQARMRDGLVEGTRVVLTSGMFATVTHVGTEQVIVELAPGVEVTALKTAVARVVAASDEEFEFADDVDDAEAVAAGEAAAAVEAPARPEGHLVRHEADADLDPASDGATMANAPAATEQALGTPVATSAPMPSEAGLGMPTTTQTPTTDRPAV